jgi:hypothetical protein
MARQTAGLGVLGLALVLLGVLIVVPFLKGRFPQYYEGYQGVAQISSDMRVQQLLANGQADSAHPDCVGVTCAEGQFCQRNTCIPIYPGPGQY